jgi:hypothetical protein
VDAGPAEYESVMNEIITTAHLAGILPTVTDPSLGARRSVTAFVDRYFRDEGWQALPIELTRHSTTDEHLQWVTAMLLARAPRHQPISRPPPPPIAPSTPVTEPRPIDTVDSLSKSWAFTMVNTNKPTRHLSHLALDHDLCKEIDGVNYASPEFQRALRLAGDHTTHPTERFRTLTMGSGIQNPRDKSLLRQVVMRKIDSNARGIYPALQQIGELHKELEPIITSSFCSLLQTTSIEQDIRGPILDEFLYYDWGKVPIHVLAGSYLYKGARSTCWSTFPPEVIASGLAHHRALMGTLWSEVQPPEDYDLVESARLGLVKLATAVYIRTREHHVALNLIDGIRTRSYQVAYELWCDHTVEVKRARDRSDPPPTLAESAARQSSEQESFHSKIDSLSKVIRSSIPGGPDDARRLVEALESSAAWANVQSTHTPRPMSPRPNPADISLTVDRPTGHPKHPTSDMLTAKGRSERPSPQNMANRQSTGQQPRQQKFGPDPTKDDADSRRNRRDAWIRSEWRSRHPHECVWALVRAQGCNRKEKCSFANSHPRSNDERSARLNAAYREFESTLPRLMMPPGNTHQSDEDQAMMSLYQDNVEDPHPSGHPNVPAASTRTKDTK